MVIIYDNMPHWDFIWVESLDGNLEHLAANHVSAEEAEHVVKHPTGHDLSRTTGELIAFGYSTNGRRLAVVYQKIDEATVYVITAYDVEKLK
jgi:hypothetical protein